MAGVGGEGIGYENSKVRREKNEDVKK